MSTGISVKMRFMKASTSADGNAREVASALMPIDSLLQPKRVSVCKGDLTLAESM